MTHQSRSHNLLRSMLACFGLQFAPGRLVWLSVIASMLFATGGVVQAQDADTPATSTPTPEVTSTSSSTPDTTDTSTSTLTSTPTSILTSTPTSTLTSTSNPTPTTTPTQDTYAADIFPNHAGVVVDFGNEVVLTECVDLGATGRSTGVQILTDSGLSIHKIVESTDADGREDAEVCMIDSQGCASDEGQDCFCQCDDTSCEQWIYYELEAGTWQRRWSAGKRDVTPGMVVGWVWGDTQAAVVSPPALRSFDDICRRTTPTATPTTTATRKTMPTETSSPSPTPTVSATATPTELPTATTTGLPTATTTGLPTATITALPTATDPPAPEQTEEIINRNEQPRTQLYLPLVMKALPPATANTQDIVPTLPPDMQTPSPGAFPTPSELPPEAPVVTPTTLPATATPTALPPSATLEATSEVWFPIDIDNIDSATSIPITTTMRAGLRSPAADDDPAMGAAQTLTAQVPAPTDTVQGIGAEAVSRFPSVIDAYPGVPLRQAWMLMSLVVLMAVVLVVLTIVVHLR